MRNIRSYLIEPQISAVQPLSYYRLKSTTGSTYGSKYKRRYGTQQIQVPSTSPQKDTQQPTMGS